MLGQFLFGLVVGMPIAFVFRRLYGEGIDLRRTLRSIPYAFLYVALFIRREVVVGNVDVTYRVLAPSQPIEPEVILISLRVRTDLGVTTIANSITITPGTITLDYDEAENALYVHVIDGRDPEAIVRPIRNWEDYALRIFDEELSLATLRRTSPSTRRTRPTLSSEQAGGGPDAPAVGSERIRRSVGSERIWRSVGSERIWRSVGSERIWRSVGSERIRGPGRRRREPGVRR